MTTPITPSPAAIEAAARALWMDASSEYDYAWEPNAGTFRSQAREVLTAAYAIDFPRIVAEKTAAIERLGRWKAEALTVMEGLQGLGRALGLDLGHQITGLEAQANAEALRAQRDTTLAQLAAVTALVEGRLASAPERRTEAAHGAVEVLADLRAILTNPTAAVDAFVRGVKADALREAAVQMRSCKDIGHWNLRDPLDPDTSYSPDRWLEARADALAEGVAGKRHLITTPHDGHPSSETCPTCPHTPTDGGTTDE